MRKIVLAAAFAGAALTLAGCTQETEAPADDAAMEAEAPAEEVAPAEETAPADAAAAPADAAAAPADEAAPAE